MMNQVAIPRQPRNPDCADSMSLAERELAAFFGAAKELFGPELAELSAEEWLRELKQPMIYPLQPPNGKH